MNKDSEQTAIRTARDAVQYAIDHPDAQNDALRYAAQVLTKATQEVQK